VWSEDGPVFIQQAETRSFWWTLTRTYGGYIHTVPRIVAEWVTAFPLQDASRVMNVTTAILHGLLALLAWHALGGVVRNQVLRLVVPLLICTAPVGAETAVSLANMQWPLQIVCVLIVLFWRPTKATVVAIAAAVLFLTALSTAFTVVILALLGLRMIWERNRTTVTYAITLGVGTILQLIAMSTSRARRPGHAPLSSLVPRYVRRVVAQLFIGDNRATTTSTAVEVVVGLLAIALLAVLGTAAVRRGGRRTALNAGWMLGASVLFYVVPVFLKPPLIGWALGGTRYALAPGVFLVAALCIAADALLPIRRERGALPVLTGVAGTALFTALAVAIVANVQSAWSYARTDNWPAEVRAARAQCSTLPSVSVVKLAISPPGWHVSLPCSDVR
jgi:hypothetical protein